MTEPSGYTALDLIGFSDKGTYSGASTYVENDLVHYGGNVWRCLVDDTTAVTPVEGATWTIFVEKPTTAIAENIAPVESSSITTNAYAAGEQLIYNDVLYTAKIAIAVGDSLVVGTNIQASDNLITQISDAVTDGIEALDYSDSAVTSNYVTAVSETDGVIAVTREAADASPTQSSNKLVTSGGVYSALSGKADSATTLAGYGINDAYTTTQTDNAISTAINALDVSDSAVSGSYVTAVSETDGEISVTREAADATPTQSSTKMVTSGGVYTALSSKAEKSTISDAYNASTAYAVGDHFIYNDVIYTVNVACTGITPPNANYYTANNLTDLIEANSSQISDLANYEVETLTLSDTTNFKLHGSNPMKFVKFGKMRFLSISIDLRTSLTADTNYVICQLDSSDYPSNNVSVFGGVYKSGLGYQMSLRAWVSPSTGEVAIMPQNIDAVAGGYFGVSMCWIV